MDIKNWLIILALFLLLDCYAQKTVTFPSIDGLTVTADLYVDKIESPYMILFHQEGSSRGEYRESAPKMMKFGYNCLAVDLRSGKEENFIKNETYQSAIRNHKKTDYVSSIMDIQAAIDYIFQMDTTRPVVIVGSSFSASLCLIVAENNPKIKAVIAFSPGEYFGSAISLKDSLAGFDKPALITGSTDEASYWKELFANTSQAGFTFFVPEKKKGMHGSKALWSTCDAQIDYWIELMMFFKKIR
jgi:predicted alpha/beta hydrolase